MPSPLSSRRPWFLLPHLGGYRFRWLHSRTPLLLSFLSTHGFSIARVRLALSSFQRLRDQLVFAGPSTPGAESTRSCSGGLSSKHGVSTRPVLDSSFSKASDEFVCSFNERDHGKAGDGFPESSLRHARSDRLDRSPSLPVRRTAHALARLAAFSPSPWSSRQFRHGFAPWLTANTEHLSCGENFSCIPWASRRNFSMDAKAEKMALFRYGLIAPLVLETLPRGELMRRAREIAARHNEIPGSQRISICLDTLLLWARRYRQGGFEALAPKPRQDRGQSRTITPQLAELIERLKRENPHRTGKTLLNELALSARCDSRPISASTLYRFLHQHGLTERQLLAVPGHKKFHAEYSNHIWQSDMLFGPYIQRAGGGKMQAFLYAILDDASRLIPHAQFYGHQTLDAFLDCLRQAVAARGLPLRLYVDNGTVYRSQQLARIAASLGILITHTPPYQPEGRGKIERFFRTVREQFLANLDRSLALSLEQLNERLWAWIDHYHRTEHGGLGTTPLLRWQRDIEHVRQLPPATDLRRLFFHRLDRLVRRDSTFLLHNGFYEAPSHLAGQRIEVRFDPLDRSQVEIYFQGQAQGWVRPVDPVVNAQLSSPKAAASPAPQPSGINFVELLQQKKAPDQQKE